MDIVHISYISLSCPMRAAWIVIGVTSVVEQIVLHRWINDLVKSIIVDIPSIMSIMLTFMLELMIVKVLILIFFLCWIISCKVMCIMVHGEPIIHMWKLIQICILCWLLCFHGQVIDVFFGIEIHVNFCTGLQFYPWSFSLQLWKFSCILGRMPSYSSFWNWKGSLCWVKI